MLVYFTYHYLIQGVAGSELIKGRITGRSRYYYKSKFENEGGTASADLGMGKRSIKRIWNGKRRSMSALGFVVSCFHSVQKNLSWGLSKFCLFLWLYWINGTLAQGATNCFFAKSLRINILDLVNHVISFATTQLSCFCMKATIGNTKMNACGCVPIKPDLQKQAVGWIWPVGPSLLTPAIAHCFPNFSPFVTTVMILLLWVVSALSFT